MAVPVVGTLPCGEARTVRLSPNGSHVHTDGWRLKSMNQSQPTNASRLPNNKLRLRFIAPLHRTVRFEQRFSISQTLWRSFDVNAVLVAREARVETGRADDLWNA